MNIQFVRYVATTCLLAATLCSLQAQQTSSILDKRITINIHNTPLKEALQKISTEANVGFSYSDELVSLPKRVTIDAESKPLKAVLDIIVCGHNTTYRTVGNQIVFFAKKMPAPKFSLSGYVSNAANSERLIGCVVYDSTSRAGVNTNPFGYFSLSLDKGLHNITFLHLGSAKQSIKIDLRKDTSLTVNLQEVSYQLSDVTITNSKPDQNLSKAQSSLMSINSNDIKKIPVLLGEADVLRAIQVMPGIQAANERSTGISVRGGSIDQNLFLMDDAPIFQVSHLMGFYSVFNNDAVKDIKVYKGDIPANYGGRLSSVVDVRLKDGNMQHYAVAGGLGFVTSNLSVEGPIVKDRISFIASGKAFYAGFLYNLFNPNMSSSFYDLNIKLNAILGNKDRFYLSTYAGSDNFSDIVYQNKTLSLRWNHIYTPKLFSNISLIYSNFKTNFAPSSEPDDSYQWKSGIGAATLKAEYNYYLNNNNNLDFGVSSTFDCFYPGKLEGNREVVGRIVEKTPFTNRIVDEKRVLDHVIYISNQQRLTDRLSVRYGLRSSLYQLLGGHWVYNLDGYQFKDSFYVAKNHTYANRFVVEPRASLCYRLTGSSSIKASYSYATQQSQLLVRSNGGSPLDIWFPSNNNIKPQTSSQYSCGYVQYLFDKRLEATIEGYYKDMHNIIDYKDGATFLQKGSITGIDKTSYNFEEQLRVGKGYSYGIETELKWMGKNISGFASYTYARSKRKISDINNGNIYLSPFDKPHTINLLVNLNLTKRLTLSANYRYQSGQVTTVPLYVGTMFDKVFMEYSNRNEYRLPAYSRLDLSLTLKNRERPGHHYHSEWNLSIINVTNHTNIQYLKFDQSKDDPSIINTSGVTMLGLMPSISYHFFF